RDRGDCRDHAATLSRARHSGRRPVRSCGNSRTDGSCDQAIVFRGQPLCKAAVDLACYDLWGHQTNCSVFKILGGGRQKQVKLSWTIQSPTMAGAESQLALASTRGYDSFNIKLGYPQTPKYDLQLVRTVCNFAPNGFHWADANTNYDVETALAMAPK